ncbi:hypothetical protein DM01DRAFT_1333370 [Hesseltinella vesiculosa]|uniref:Histone acetyltransferases subunit 3-domain-containing protein n=1 Tax=Hesseltinella vesiculosa TaxID=101127 RepID=A0A1X2GPR4_9FUNG|nr:hypothetical protein DM01DRAFT_1333370 [Hesseltinella vesiculosa]
MDATRQYSLPIPVSTSTAAHYRQLKNGSSSNISPSQLGAIPESQELMTIKNDLEGLLPFSETRIAELKKDYNHIDKNVKIKDQIGSKKNASNATVDKGRTKQEPDDIFDPLPSNPKSDRQAALETLKRRRRREETDSDSDIKQGKIRRSDLVSSPLSRSMSPPPTNSKHAPKSVDFFKKKKNGNDSSNARAHQLTNGDLFSSPKKKNGNNSNNDVDFVRVKPKDQVPITTFWTYLDPYFRSVTEEDREFLLQKGDDVTPYLIPPLGPYYKDVWNEEDRGLPNSRPQSPAFSSHHDDSSHSNHPTDRLKYVNPDHSLTDDYLMTDDISSGTLAERLLSSLVAEDVGVTGDDLASYVAASHDDLAPDPEDVDMPQAGGRTVVELSSQPPDAVVDFEERLKRELRYAGLFADDEVEWNAKEDDEICAELRRLGRELKEQVSINEFRKKRLLEVTDKQLQYEQYRHVLDNLDTQVEQCYIKRFRTQKSKKRKGPAVPRTALSENAIHAMEKRKMWIDKLGPIFKDMNMTLPQHSIYDTDTDPTPGPSSSTTAEDS